MSNLSKAYLLGGGIGSLAAAAFMIRDGEFSGENITILEAKPVMGGSLDGAGNPTDGYSLRGGRMLTTDNYECTWDLFKSIPSLTLPGKTVFDETIEFNEKYKSHAMARLIDRQRAKVPVSSMGFSMHDRQELLRWDEKYRSKLIRPESYINQYIDENWVPLVILRAPDPVLATATKVDPVPRPEP